MSDRLSWLVEASDIDLCGNDRIKLDDSRKQWHQMSLLHKLKAWWKDRHLCNKCINSTDYAGPIGNFGPCYFCEHHCLFDSVDNLEPVRNKQGKVRYLRKKEVAE